jgi:hypothetical protein
MFHIVVAESVEEYLDYIDVNKIPDDDVVFAKDTLKIEELCKKVRRDFTLHITKFAAEKDELKVRFMDIQLYLLTLTDKIETVFEVE